jgi:serine/threonine protein kinase
LGNSRITRTGNVIGTMEYMSPEQIRGEETDARSDIYSLGILLYEMLTGRVPFECNSEYELMRRQVEDAPIPPRTFTKEIPLAVEQVIMRALAKRPEARFQTADEFRAVLIKSLGDATAKLVIPASNLATEIPQQAPQQVPQQISQNSKPLAEAQNSFAQASTSAAKKKLPDTLDFSSEPPKEVKETRLADDAQAQQILKETRLAEEAQARLLEQQIKETRLANQQQQQNQQQPIPWQNPLYQQSYADAKIAPQDFRKPKTSSVEAFLNKLSWKHYVAAVLLALLSIPVAFIASSSNTPEPNANQSRSAKNVSGLSGQRNEPANSTEPPAETPAQQPAANPEPVSGTDTITPVSPNDSTDAPAKPSTGGKRARRASSTPQPVEAKRRDDNGSDKKDEKKGGIFGKLKGGLKKINPFKKD